MSFKRIIDVIFVVFIGVVLFFPGSPLVAAADADVAIIVNPTVSTSTTMTKANLKDIFTGKIVKWDDNQQIKLTTVKKSNTHETFVKTFVHKTPAQFDSYWKKMVFTGKGGSPKNFKTEEELVKYVSKTDGAIGYVSSEAKAEGVKVVKISDM